MRVRLTWFIIMAFTAVACGAEPQSTDARDVIDDPEPDTREVTYRMQGEGAVPPGAGYVRAHIDSPDSWRVWSWEDGGESQMECIERSGDLVVHRTDADDDCQGTELTRTELDPGGIFAVFPVTTLDGAAWTDGTVTDDVEIAGDLDVDADDVEVRVRDDQRWATAGDGALPVAFIADLGHGQTLEAQLVEE